MSMEKDTAKKDINQNCNINIVSPRLFLEIHGRPWGDFEINL